MSAPIKPSPPNLEHRPLQEVLSIAWPTVVTMTSYTVMQFVDKLMIGQVGPIDLAAASNGGIWAFVPLAAAFGFLTVINTFVSQNVGAKKPERGPAYAWCGLWISVVIWLLFLIPYAAILPYIFSVMPEATPELVQKETGYAQIELVGAIVLLGSRSMNNFFFGLQRPRVVTFSAIVGNIVNAVMNYILIFGEAGCPSIGIPGIPGMPAMGVYGAAIGTVIGTVFEFIIPFAIFLGPKLNNSLHTRSAWRFHKESAKDLLTIGWPPAVQFVSEIICWAIFMTVLVGSYGEAQMTASWIVLTYMHLSFMPAVGLSVATNSLVGKYIGAGKPDVAVKRARLSLVVAMSYMTLCTVLFIVFRNPLVEIFIGGNATLEQIDVIIVMGGKLMICAAFFQTVDAIGIVYTGALRGAGDTKWPSMITVVFSWTLIIGLGWLITTFWPQLQALGPWIGAAIYVIAFGITMGIRFEGGAWRRIKLLPGAAGHPKPSIISPGPPASEADASIRDMADAIGEAEVKSKQ
ncbi:MAG: MATE family efflux transporter [Phycisphaerales bacterium]|nr:MATE family efflux transporter [Phycisphaerales bacterium]